MSEILTLMSGEDRRAFSAMVGALAQKELGHSPALTHYMQSTGVLRSDAERVASCESFGLEDDGADKDLARQGAEGADRLDKSGAKVSGAADQAIQDMDELGSHLEEAKKKGNGVKVAVFAAAMATLHTAATLLKYFRSVRNSTENQKALISALKEKRAGLWSDLQKASKAYATTHVSRQGLEDAAHKYVSTRNELTSALNDAKLYKGMVKGSNVKLAIGASIGFAITFATYWVITKVVIGAIALAKKSVGPASGESAGTENFTSQCSEM